MKYFHHLQHIVSIVNAYHGEEPLSRFLSSYFRQNKQMGSKDRKFAARYMYAYYRLGKALLDVSLENRVAIADFLCNNSPSPIAGHFLPEEFSQFWTLALDDKLEKVKKFQENFNIEDIFPHQSAISGGISKQIWAKRLLRQPDLFIRVMPAKLTAVRKFLEENQIQTTVWSDSCIGMPNAAKLAGLLEKDLYVVQDFSSQRTAKYFEAQPYEYWWDCCAASGGKSLLLHSYCPTVKVLASDIRPQILENLKERFYAAKVQKFQVKILDLTLDNKAQLSDYEFDGILVDAPCTGSGTWSRTPENNVFFDEKNIDKFTQLQEKIVSNVWPYLKKGKPLVYITCSIFEAENELMVQRILKKHPDMILERSELIDGIIYNADQMFVARFLKQ